MEEKLRAAKFHCSHTVDITDFKARFWNALDEQRQPAAGNTKINFRRKLALIAIPMILLPAVAGFAAYKSLLTNARIEIRSQDQDFTNYETPLDIFTDFTKFPDFKLRTPKEAKPQDIYPVHIPTEIKGWKRIMSGTRPTNGIFKEDSPLSYIDLYTNRKGQKAVVIQMYDQSMTESLKRSMTESLKDKFAFHIGFPKGTKILDDFGDDLAALMDLQKGRYELTLFHKEANGQITDFEIWSNAYTSEILTIAHAYLQVPGK